MLMLDIERYLELRRALGYKLETTEFLLRDFARFASARGDTHVASHTAMEWAGQTTTARQSHRRLTAINCVANGRLLREGPYKDIWIQPAAGDAGGAIGAAAAIWHQYLGNPRKLNGVTDSMAGAYLARISHQCVDTWAKGVDEDIRKENRLN